MSSSQTAPALAWTDLDRQAVDVSRALAMDAVEAAGSGHPGTAMSLAPAAYLLYQRLLRHDPSDPDWTGRDRFVLSCGHTSLTLYVQLFLSGYGLTVEDIAHLRQWGSLTPGHPEHGHTPGVEVTTGPLGQGVGNAVGMAMAARFERGLLTDAPLGGLHELEDADRPALVPGAQREPEGGRRLALARAVVDDDEGAVAALTGREAVVRSAGGLSLGHQAAFPFEVRGVAAGAMASMRPVAETCSRGT